MKLIFIKGTGPGPAYPKTAPDPEPPPKNNALSGICFVLYQISVKKSGRLGYLWDFCQQKEHSIQVIFV